jgi:DNA-binding protein H-NS
MNENLLKELSDEKNKDNLLQQELEMIKEISKKQKEENELFQEKLKDRDKEINLLKEQALNHKQLISKYLINQESQIQELRFNFDCFQKNESIESRVEMPPKS